jgi:transposase
MHKKNAVSLKKDEKSYLIELISKGTAQARKIKRGNILLLADKGKSDKEISEALKTSYSTIERTRKKYVEYGLKFALNEKSRSGAPKSLDGRGEALLIATVCSEPPEGRTRWTMRLLEKNLIELNVSDTTIQRTLKKMKLSLG